MSGSLKKTREPWQDPDIKPYIYLENVSKHFRGVKAVNDLTLSIYQGEFFSLLGSSGCGKSTLLRMLAGFEQPSSGKIFIDGVDVAAQPPYSRPVNMMFQSYALFPHMSVEQNVAFGLKQDRMSPKKIQEKVNWVLDLVQMHNFKSRKPHQLSGGQKQRVALARSLVKQPKLLLLDEPLGALDKNLRERTQLELVTIQEQVGITFIMVTHDQEEAMTVSTRIGIMDEGRLMQIGPPTEVYEFPNSKFTANFIGSTNIFDGLAVTEDENYLTLQSEGLGTNILIGYTSEVPMGAQVDIAVRPEKINISKQKPEGVDNCIRGVVEDIAYLGDVSIYHVKLPTGKTVLAQLSNQVRLSDMPVTWEDKVYIYWQAESCVVLSG